MVSPAIKLGDTPARAQVAFGRTLGHLASVQRDTGAFAGEVTWNPMLPCQYVIMCHVLGKEIPGPRRERIHRALARQVRADGGWGMHPDSPSYLFHTVLGYVALRLLGYPSSDSLAARALGWIRDHGGVYAVPTWGRVWLAIIGLYPWSGVQPILPELWLLPDAAPLHPRRLYCHMRLIYLGLSYLYGTRFVAPMDGRVQAIASELYPEGYDEAKFVRFRDAIAPTDVFEAPSPALRLAFAGMRTIERLSPARLRRAALRRAMEHIVFEFRSTGWVCLSPVTGFTFCLALYICDDRHPDLERAMRGMEYWVWEDDAEGLRFAGARSDIWDTSFTIQALAEGPRSPASDAIVRRACEWLPRAQLLEEIVGGARHYREPAYGGFGFANEHHPWPVSDCTAEAVEALMKAAKATLASPSGRLDLGRKLAAVDFVLARQNDDGGFGSYEPRRGPMLLRRFNPAEIYGNCMLEYSYTECTASCIRGLAYVHRELGNEMPAAKRSTVTAAIDRGVEFLLGAQHESGGWLGFWGINLTYGTFFAVGGLLAAGVPPTHPAIVRASRWLVETQRADGGWAERYEGVLAGTNVQAPTDEVSSATQSAWALLTLLHATPHEHAVIERGIEFLIAKQSQTGAWPAERATGVFFNTAVLDYELYRQIFPTWALARYLRAHA